MRKPDRKTKMNLVRAASTMGLPPAAARRALPRPEVRIEAVCLREPRPGELVARAAVPWRTPTDGAAFLVLDGRMRLGDLAAVARALCAANRVLPRGGVDETLADLLEVPSLSLPGGIAFSMGGSRVVAPGCCAGVEGWRAWGALVEGGAAPWGGHDPFASAIVRGREVHVFSDAGSPPRIVVDRGEYGQLLLDVERDLLLFARRFEGWLLETAPSVAAPLAAKLARDLQIVPG
jgi:hypothetical protein